MVETLDFSEELKNFSHNGISLNLDERMQLEMAIMSLRTRVEHDELHFWGKINGLVQDYYVCVGVTYCGQYEFPTKNFYWALASSGYNFKEMPTLSEAHNEYIDQDQTPFIGEPTKVIDAANKDDADGDGDGEPVNAEAENSAAEGSQEGRDSDDTDQEDVTVPKRDLTELDRLTFCVYAIENDCQICPTGSFKMTSEHQVRRNEAFQGLCQQSG
jgi:radial spoke head protein 9